MAMASWAPSPPQAAAGSAHASPRRCRPGADEAAEQEQAAPRCGTASDRSVLLDTPRCGTAGTVGTTDSEIPRRSPGAWPTPPSTAPTGRSRAAQGSRCSTAASAASSLAQQWAQKRRVAIEQAESKREAHLVAAGDLLPLVPKNAGLAVPIDTSPPSRKQVPRGPRPPRREQAGAALTPLRRRLLVLAESKYAKPVWHEVYGP